MLNTVFLALIIFYVYPLRFLTLFLTNFFFDSNIGVKIEGTQVPYLMIYYGAIAFAMYFVLFMCYVRAEKLSKNLAFNSFEKFYTNAQKKRLLIMWLVPLLSIAASTIIKQYNFVWASITGGLMYCLYSPLILWWYIRYKKKEHAFPVN